MRILRQILLQTSIVCSFACIITKILDWYNPYMNFSGHIWYIQAVLYLSVIGLGLVTGSRKRLVPKRKRGPKSGDFSGLPEQADVRRVSCKAEKRQGQ